MIIRMINNVRYFNKNKIDNIFCTIFVPKF